MRLATLTALCLVAAATTAQTPDPTPPAAYYPLGVGDIREYRGAGGTSSFPRRYVLRESVVGDTLVGEQSYRLVERLRSEDGGPLVRSRHAVRFDPAAAQPVEHQPDGSEAPLTMCRLDLPYGAPPSDACGAFQNGEPDGLVVIGSDQVTTSVKGFANFAYSEFFAAGIGFVEGLYETSEFTDRLTYARIGGVSYGTPDPVLPPLSGEGAPSASALALAVGPNPTGGPLALSLTLTAPSAVTVEAVDALGRRVLQATTTLGAGAQTFGVDASRWAPGLYVVRVTVGEASATVRVVRR